MPGSPITFSPLDNTILADTIGRATGGFLGDYKRNQQNKNEGTILQTVFKEIGENPDYTTPDIMQALARAQEQGVSPQTIQRVSENYPKFQAAQKKGTSANDPLVGASKALDSLEELIGKPGIGATGGFNLSDKARYNRGVFESTQAAVLPLFKSMFPRGMTEKEFKFIQDKYIPQASDTEQTIKGKIHGLRQLMQGSAASSEGMPKTSERQQSERTEDTLQLRHKGTGKTAPVPRDKFLGLPVAEQELYEQI